MSTYFEDFIPLNSKNQQNRFGLIGEDFPFSVLCLQDFKLLNVMISTFIFGHNYSEYLHDTWYIFCEYESILFFVVAIEDLSIFFDKLRTHSGFKFYLLFSLFLWLHYYQIYNRFKKKVLKEVKHVKKDFVFKKDGVLRVKLCYSQ